MDVGPVGLPMCKCMLYITLYPLYLFIVQVAEQFNLTLVKPVVHEVEADGEINHLQSVMVPFYTQTFFVWRIYGVVILRIHA